MAMKIKLTQKMAQKMALTPQMRQSIHILQLPLPELKEYLEHQLEENPTLEDGRDLELKASLSDEKINKLLERREEFKADSESFFNAGYSQEEAQKKQSYRESLVTKGPTLQEHLIRQLRMQELDENEYKIAELIIGNIDQNGYFQSSIEDIVQALSSKGIEVKSEDANKILAILQTFDPIGIGARDLKECLIIQLKAKEKQNSLCYQIVEHYLPDLARNKLKNIAKALKVSLDKIKEAAKEISLLEPKPGRAFTQSETRRVISRSPDIIVEKIDEQYEVIVNNRELPKLKISAQYKNLLNRKDTPEETKNYLKEKINSALWLIKAVMQRQDTIRRIAECIIDIQKDFFAQGQEEQLKPLTLQEVAQRVGRNESTISRVVNNKYIQTPYGIFKLDYFFSGSYQTEQGEAISSEAVKSQIIALIDEEDHQHPLSDDKIVKLFKAQGINIARRTIAKYREELKIPPSHQRKQ